MYLDPCPFRRWKNGLGLALGCTFEDSKMKKITLAIALGTVLLSGAASAQSTGDSNEPIYGSQIMTDQERVEHRNLMRDAPTQQDRERIRTEHHELMRERARERGITLPDTPPARGGMGQGMGQGTGMGQGMGQGNGMGQGMGQGAGKGQGPGMGQGTGQGQGNMRNNVESDAP